MRLLVCGGRDYADYDYFKTVLSALHVERGIDVVIQGNANGADRLARQWAERHLVPVLSFSADWANHGKAAGPRRNADMLRDGKPDMVVAFPGGRGTADMMLKARAAGVEVLDARPRRCAR